MLPNQGRCGVWPPYTCFPPTLARPQILSLVALNKDLAGYATRMTGRVAGPILPPANTVTMCVVTILETKTRM